MCLQRSIVEQQRQTPLQHHKVLGGEGDLQWYCALEGGGWGRHGRWNRQGSVGSARASGAFHVSQAQPSRLQDAAHKLIALQQPHHPRQATLYQDRESVQDMTDL